MPARRSAAANTAAARLPRCLLPAAWNTSAWVSATAAVLIAALCEPGPASWPPYVCVHTGRLLPTQARPGTGLGPRRRRGRAPGQPPPSEPFQPPIGSLTHAPGRRCAPPTPACRARHSCLAPLSHALVHGARARSLRRGSPTPLALTYDLYTIHAMMAARSLGTVPDSTIRWPWIYRLRSFR
jgi:hypothetical protein